jgi:predicted permease
MAAVRLGQFLFWIGIPLSTIAFLREANLSGPIWIAPLVAWAAIALGASLAWIVIRKQTWHQPTQGSFLLAAMVGNTGYLGYPVAVALVGVQSFAWALFYDMAGTTIGAYGLGVALANRFGTSHQSGQQLFSTLLKNPVLWSLGIGLYFRSVRLPALAEQGLQAVAWGVIALSLILIGMRLSQLSSSQRLPQVVLSLTIKMLVVPLVLGYSLKFLGLRGEPLLVMILQMAMPPAFATLILAEAFDLDRDLAVTALVCGSIGLLLMLPIWLWLFA